MTAALLVVLSLSSLVAERPNIVLIVGDDVGYGELQCYNPLSITPTPRLDQLASEGVRFVNGHTTHPICGPSRVSLMMGKNSSRFGMDMEGGGRQFGLPRDQAIFPQTLHDAGYETAAIGKWHLGAQDYNQPAARGFDEFFGFIGGGTGYFANSAARARSPILRGTEVVEEPEYLTDAFAREAVDFIDRNADGPKPFFLYLAFNAIHTPFEATAEDLAPFADIADVKRKYLSAMLAAHDRAVGRVLDELDATGIRNNTLVIYLSDNGGERAPHVDNRPLRGSKFTIFEGGIRVPMMASWPAAAWARPKVSTKLVSSLDIAVTLLKAAGAEVPPSLEGQDLGTFIGGAGASQRESPLLFRYGLEWAVINGRWKLFHQVNPENLEAHSVLYDLENDLSETTDVSDQYPGRVKQMEANYNAWEASFIPPLWGPIPDPSRTSLVLCKQDGQETYKVALLDFQSRIVASRQLPGLPGFAAAKIGRFRPEYDFDIASIEGETIKLRSGNLDASPTSTLSFNRRGATAVLGFADFNRNGTNEIVVDTAEGYRTFEYDPITRTVGVVRLNIKVSLADFNRFLGFEDLGGFDAGPDAILANANDNVIQLLFNGSRGNRFSNYMFRPRGDTNTAALPRHYIGALDANGDGYTDIFNDTGSGSASMWTTDRLRANVINTPISLGAGWRAVSIGNGGLPVSGGE